MENQPNTNTTNNESTNNKAHDTANNASVSINSVPASSANSTANNAIFSGSGRKVFNSAPTPALIEEYLKFSYNYGIFAIVNGVIFVIVTALVLILVGWVLLIALAFGQLGAVLVILLFVVTPFVGAIYALVQSTKLIHRKLTREKQFNMTGWMVFFAFFQAIPCIFLGYIVLRNLINYQEIVSTIFFCVFVILTLNSCAMIFFSLKFRSRLNHEYFTVAENEGRRVASKVITSSHEGETSSREGK